MRPVSEARLVFTGRIHISSMQLTQVQGLRDPGARCLGNRRYEASAGEIEDGFALMIAAIASRILQRGVELVSCCPRSCNRLRTYHAEDAPQGRSASEDLRRMRAPFIWRKKRAKDWDNVKICSDRCKGELHFGRTGLSGQPPVQ